MATILIGCAVIFAGYWIVRLLAIALSELIPRSDNRFALILRTVAAISLFLAFCITAWCLFHGHAGTGISIGGVLLLMLLAARRWAFHL